MFKSSILVMIMNMLSRLLGLFREIIIGSLFGATGLTDAYISATKIPNFFTTILGEGSLGTVFIPIYNKTLEKEGNKASEEFLFSLINLMISITFTLSILMIIFSKEILKITTAFKDNYTFEIANNMLKIVGFYFLFIALSGIVSSFLNNYRKFLISSLMGIIFNLTIIIITLLTNAKLGIYSLGVGYLFSGIFQLLFMLPSFFKIIKTYKFIFNIKNTNVIEMFYLMIPTLIGIFGYQFNEIIDNRFASMLKSGTVSSLNYASRLYLLPIGVFAISLSVVIFPILSKSVVKNNLKNTKKIMNNGLQFLTILIIPSAIILFNYSYEIVSLIYERGNFTKTAVIMTSDILKIYALGLFFFSSIHLLTRGHYVFKNRKIPVISAFIAIFINILLDYLLYKKFEHIGLTFATSFSAMINYFILLFSINKRHIKINFRKYILVVVMTIITSFLAYYLSNLIQKYNIFGKYTIILTVFIFAIIYLIEWITIYITNNKYVNI